MRPLIGILIVGLLAFSGGVIAAGWLPEPWRPEGPDIPLLTWNNSARDDSADDGSADWGTFIPTSEPTSMSDAATPESPQPEPALENAEQVVDEPDLDSSPETPSTSLDPDDASTSNPPAPDSEMPGFEGSPFEGFEETEPDADRDAANTEAWVDVLADPEADWPALRGALEALGAGRYWIEGRADGSVRFRCVVEGPSQGGSPGVGGGRYFEVEGRSLVQAARSLLQRIVLWRSIAGDASS